MVLDVVDGLDRGVLPGCIREEANELEQYTKTQRLAPALAVLRCVMARHAYRDGDEQSYTNASSNGQGCLLVVLAGEQGGILKSTVGANQR
jgi:hypothetical protein